MTSAIPRCTAYEVDEVKDIRDNALAIEIYARQALNIKPSVVLRVEPAHRSLDEPTHLVGAAEQTAPALPFGGGLLEPESGS